MSKMTVRFCREETWFVDIEVEASTRAEAEELAEAKRDQDASELNWEACDGNDYEPYLSNVFDDKNNEVDE